MNRHHFWRSISKETNVEVSALSPGKVVSTAEGLFVSEMGEIFEEW